MASTVPLEGNGNGGGPRAGGPSAPPHNLEAEQSVLGALLLSDRAMYALAIEDGLRADDFYRDRHRRIYTAMLALYARNEPVDAISVTEHLRLAGELDDIGGDSAIHALAGEVPAAGNVRHYGKIVRENALLRRLLNATYSIQQSVSGHEAEPRELVELAEQRMLEVARDDRQKEFRPIGDVLDAEVDKLEALSRNQTSLTGTPSGYKALDDITGGFQPGNLIVIAARPAMGKSALVTNIAENVALKSNGAVALFSLEMSESELAQRFIASEAKIGGEKLRKGKVAESEWPKIVRAAESLSKAPLYIDDSSDVAMLDIRAKARRLHTQVGGLALVIVDYLQLLRPEPGVDNRVQQVGQMSRGLKLLARELECPVIALSQLNRAVEERRPKPIPMLADLRESGSIEQDADLVMFIYRDEYYFPEESDNPTDRPGEADLIISKHRNGPLGTVELAFRREFPKFMTLAKEYD